MIKYLLQIIKKSSYLSLGQILQGLISISLLPVYTRLLTKADIGMIDMLIIFQSIISLFILVGMRQGFTRTYLLDNVKKDSINLQKDKYSILSTTLLFLLLWGSFILFFVFNFSSHISKFFFQSDQYSHLIFFATASALGFSLCQIYESYFLNSEKVKTNVIITTIQLLINFSLIILLVVKYDKGVFGVIFANTLAGLFFGLSVTIFFLIRFGVSFRLLYLKKMLRFGAPVMVSLILLVLFDIIDRIFIQYYLGLSELGAYSVGKKISKIQSMAFAGPFLGIWTPTMYKIISKDDHKKIFSKILPIITFFFCIISLSISSLSDELILIFATKEYLDASNIIFWLCMSQTLFIINTILSSGMHIVGKSEYGILVNGIVIILGIIFNILLIPSFGMIGASIGTFLTFLFQSFVFYIVFQKLYFIPYKINLSISVFILSFIWYFFIQQLQFIFSNFFYILLFKIVSIIIYFFVSIWLFSKNGYSLLDLLKINVDSNNDNSSSSNNLN